ncbi:DUF2199 domain-containing protein [Actinoplanes sp. N902-109]|uniref:DUF2199 domain-containing protein n=1 Tax=Actinoplanes sp. (strain N902-109) TaxID=649831 RepID=UPI00032966E5|nr:DUF2199 domain-containing protein [Actinoplanes sp. N902-109]AGL20760.1 hypothetical protein L083_7250 [Actinoplanes sp. N902-109]
MADHLPGCSCCGAPLDPVNLAIRTEWPDALKDLPPDRREAIWGDGTLRRDPDLGAFIRCMMPVQLTGGGTVEYSVWLRIDDNQMRKALHFWDLPEYADLTLVGTVANDVKPWEGMLGEPARAEVRDPGTIPWLIAQPETLLHRILHDTWDRDDILSRIPHALPVTIREPVTETWSLERTAGLAPFISPDGALRFTGPARTVHLFPYSGFDCTPAEAITMLTADQTHDSQDHLTEQDDQVHRHAFWRRTAKGTYNLHGYAAVPGETLHLVAVYDEPADLAWAHHVWRSIRADWGQPRPAC